MIKNQEEAIKRVSKILELEVTPFNNSKSVLISKKDIETVLSMLKENSAEIEQKNTELAEKNAEIEKKDKIIDLMAEDWFLKEGHELQIYKQRNRTNNRIFRKKRKYNQNI